VLDDRQNRNLRTGLQLGQSMSRLTTGGVGGHLICWQAVAPLQQLGDGQQALPRAFLPAKERRTLRAEGSSSRKGGAFL